MRIHRSKACTGSWKEKQEKMNPIYIYNVHAQKRQQPKTEKENKSKTKQKIHVSN